MYLTNTLTKEILKKGALQIFIYIKNKAKKLDCNV